MGLIQNIGYYASCSLGFMDELILLEITRATHQRVISALIVRRHVAPAEFHFVLRAHEGRSNVL